METLASVKHIVYKTGSILLGLSCLIIAVTLEADLKYGKQIEEQDRQFKTMQKNLETMQKINAGVSIDLKTLMEPAEDKRIRGTHDFLDTVYSGLIATGKKHLSTRTYFIEQGKASELKEALRRFVALIKSRLPEEQELQTEGMLNLDSINHKGQLVSWEEYYFGHVSITAAKKRLSTIKGEMELLELENRQ